MAGYFCHPRAWLFPRLAEAACSCTAKLHAQMLLFPALTGLGILKAEFYDGEAEDRVQP